MKIRYSKKAKQNKTKQKKNKKKKQTITHCFFGVLDVYVNDARRFLVVEYASRRTIQGINDTKSYAHHTSYFTVIDERAQKSIKE